MVKKKASIKKATPKKSSPKKKTSTRRVITKQEPSPYSKEALMSFIVDHDIELETETTSPPRKSTRGPKDRIRPYKPSKETFTKEEEEDLQKVALGYEKESTIDISTPIPRTSLDSSIPESALGIDLAANLKWSKYIPNIPSAKQLAALMLPHVSELLYGGALGGGKSDWLAMEALRYCDLPNYSSIIFRKHLTDLSQPGALIARIGQWLEPHKQEGSCRYDGTNHIWEFRTVWPGTDIPGPPAKLQFGYIGTASIRERYMSAEYQFVGFDELGQWVDDTDYLFMMTRIRKNVCPIHKRDANNNPIYVKGCRYCDVLSQLPLRMRAASNPGPAWMKQRFGIKPDPTQYPTARHALIAIAEGKKVRWVGTNSDARFLPAYLWDNPHLDYKSYDKMLKELPESERSRLQDGNWEARVDSRFKRQWQRYVQLNLPQPFLQKDPDLKDFGGKFFTRYIDYTYDYVEYDSKGNTLIREGHKFSSLQKIFVTVDVAVTVARGPVDVQAKKKNSSTVISVWGITQDDCLLWLHCYRYKLEIPDVLASLIERNTVWTPQQNKIEVSGVGIGVAQWLERSTYPVTKNWKKTDKLENSMSAQILMKRYRILFPTNAEWLEEAEDQIFSWTGLPEEEDDIIDTLSDAANELGPTIARELAETQNEEGLIAPYNNRPFAIPYSSPGNGFRSSLLGHLGGSRISMYFRR